MKTYQIRKIMGEPIVTANGHLFKISGYLVGAAKMNGYWNVTELSTGTAITYAHPTMKDAMKDAHDTIKRLGDEKFNYAIKANIDKYGRLNENITPDMCREYVG